MKINMAFTDKVVALFIFLYVPSCIFRSWYVKIIMLSKAVHGREEGTVLQMNVSSKPNNVLCCTHFLKK